MKSIKITLIILTILGSAFMNDSSANVGETINKKLEEKVKFNTGDLSLEKNRTDFVRVSFKINAEGKLEILDINYSNASIKTQLVEKLSEIKIVGDFNSTEIFNYQFTFKQV